MKRIITLAVIFVLAAALLTACRSGGDDNMTTTGDPHTLPQTTGATITTPMETTTRPVETTRPSTTTTVPGTDDGSMPNGSDGAGTTPGGTNTEPGARGGTVASFQVNTKCQAFA